jgi:hypothetical protein
MSTLRAVLSDEIRLLHDDRQSLMGFPRHQQTTQHGNSLRTFESERRQVFIENL